MKHEFGEIIFACGMQFLYCGPCPVKPELLSIVLPFNDINNPQKVLNITIEGRQKRAC